ncbi:hypothetical protein CLV60_117112 [Dyadobacter jiangsuensis]|uniref:Alg9-like mannosyltransferase family protein n=2 Tax=Dyadobacter jiangsuensis TaxID=1591085 RepID=A0A2P8FNJ8_9BACT|nr:hypothetical protein CLV60_117112 [Dyadobacter jiangsuensis]
MAIRMGMLCLLILIYMKTFPLLNAERTDVLSFVKAIELKNLKPERSPKSQSQYLFQRLLVVDLLVLASFGYLIFPVIIFLSGFVRVEVLVVFVGLLGYGLYRENRKCIFSINFKLAIKELVVQSRIWRGHWALLGFMALIWLLFSSIGGIGYRNFDSGIRSSLLWHLVADSWPLYFEKGYFGNEFGSISEKAYVYYFAYYLPAAVVGKILGWKAANLALFAYSWLGVSLALMLVRVYVRQRGYTITLIVFTGICLFGGMDYVFNRLLGFTSDRSEMWLSPLHYFSHTRNLFWAPQHCLPTWLIIGVILNHRQISPVLIRIFPLACVSMLLWSPLCLIGIAPFILIILKHHWKEWMQWSWANTAACLLFILLTSFIVSNDFSFGMFFAPNIMQDYWVQYCVFVTAEFLILSSIFVFSNPKILKDDILIIALMLLFVIPVLILGRWNDWSIKLSIPPLFVLSIFVIKQIMWLFESKKKHMVIPLFIFAACALTPLEELTYSAKNYRISFEKPPKIRDFGPNYIVWQQLGDRGSFFFRYLARQ